MIPKGKAASAALSIESAALAGLAHAGLFVAARALLLRVPGPGDPSVSGWYANAANQRSLVTALNLITIGCIAFLWFVAVIRRRVGLRENRFFGTVFLGSALLTAAMWMIGTVLFAAPALDAYLFGTAQSSRGVAGWQAVGVASFTIVAVRLEAVFIISTTTVARLARALPRSLIGIGYGAGLLLLFAPLPSAALTWIFTAWEIAVSLALLIRHRQIEEHLAEPIPPE